MKHKFVHRFLEILFPPRCAYCNQVLAQGTACVDCTEKLPRIFPPVCLRCGLPAEVCRCRKKKAAYDAVVAPFLYEGTVAAAIRRFKFSEKPQLAKPFAAELVRCFGQYYTQECIDIVCAVPMFAGKERERGYNQSVLLAKEIAKLLELPCVPRLLKKVVDTKAQHDLDAHLRQGNVLGVFEVDAKVPLAGRRILLVDDIMTTGATLHECAKMLKLAGAQNVYALCAAVTQRKAK